LALIERTSVLITVKDANAAAIDLRVCANLEVVWHERASVSLQDDLTLEESTLGDTRVDLFGLSEHDGLVFQVVEDGDFSVSGVLETAFDNVLFEVTEESQDLLVELDISGLKLLLDVRGTHVVRELVV